MRERERKETGSAAVGIVSEVDEWLRQRSEAFYRATQRKGMPMTYGAGKDRVHVPPPEREA